MTTNEPTTETTSPTLHDRLAAKARQTRPNASLSWPVYSYDGVTAESLAAIQADLTAEATAPLQKEIDELKDELRYAKSLATNAIHHQNALRAENAALRQAGDALRDAAMVYYRKLHHASIEEMAAFRAAITAYDAATTPRAEETDAQEHINSVQAVIDGDVDPSPTDAAGEVTDGPIIVPDRLTVLEDTVAKIHSAYGDRLANLEQRATPDDQDPAKQARPHKERIDDLVTRADAANGRLDMHMQALDVLGRRVVGLEQRLPIMDCDLAAVSEDATERLSALDRRHRKLRRQHRHDHRWLRTLARDMATILDTLEARGATPQPVAVTDTMVKAFWGVYWPWDTSTGPSVEQAIEEAVRAGLTAALAAAAKDGGK